MSKIERFEDLEVWQRARKLYRGLARATSSGRFSKDFALRDQTHRAATSIAANLAEGFERGGNKEFLQFLSIAKGSGGEFRSHIYLANDRGYLTEKQFQWLLAQAE